jgi:HK97 family phage major capsid protein
MVERYLVERDKKVAMVDNIKQMALDAGRDFTDDEKTAIGAAKTRVGEIDGLLELVGDSLDMTDEAKSRITRVSRTLFQPAPYHRAGEVLYDLLHQHEPEPGARLRRAMNRAAEHMGTLIADTTATAGDLAGLVVRPVVGAVINPYASGMPLASAIGLRPVPASDGFGFSRPQVVDSGFTSGVGTQTAEKAELASKAFTITATSISLDTVGGYLNVSQQLMSFNPQALDIIVAQMRRRLEAAIETYMYAEFDNTTGKVTLSLSATADVILTAIYTAAANYYGVTKQLPSLLVVGPAAWARLGSLVDAAGRPLFPTIGAANAPGTASATDFAGTVAGLRLVVTPAITDGKMFVTGSEAIEGYMYAFPILETVEASVLGRQVAVAAAVAAYRPTPFANATQLLGP